MTTKIQRGGNIQAPQQNELDANAVSKDVRTVWSKVVFAFLTVPNESCAGIQVALNTSRKLECVVLMVHLENFVSSITAPRLQCKVEDVLHTGLKRSSVH